jgi:hypothetical protein
MCAIVYIIQLWHVFQLAESSIFPEIFLDGTDGSDANPNVSSAFLWFGSGEVTGASSIHVGSYVQRDAPELWVLLCVRFKLGLRPFHGRGIVGKSFRGRHCDEKHAAMLVLRIMRRRDTT